MTDDDFPLHYTVSGSPHDDHPFETVHISLLPRLHAPALLPIASPEHRCGMPGCRLPSRHQGLCQIVMPPDNQKRERKRTSHMINDPYASTTDIERRTKRTLIDTVA